MAKYVRVKVFVLCIMLCSFGIMGVARIFEWGGDERRRREKRGAKGAEGGRVRGGAVPFPAGGGAVPPPQKNFDYLTLKWCILVRI